MKRILIVDDAATIRMYHRQLLEAAGWKVDEAINGMEALEKSLSKHYDLYVVDVNMPKMDGCAFLRELRRNPQAHQAPAIMVSTESQAQDELAAYAAGANFYIVKPAKPDHLVRVVALMLGQGGGNA